MKIAIIGTGIAGNVAAHYLHRNHDITVYESNDYIGGHTHTHSIKSDDEDLSIDTGFIVFNDWTYPNFIKLLNELNVDSQVSDMSFSVSCESSGLEYNPTSINKLFAQRRNLLRPSFYYLIREILRFNTTAVEFLNNDNADIDFSEFLYQEKFSRHFIELFIIPMCSAIWSADPNRVFDFTANFILRFFHNHGMLSVNERPNWHVIKNGSNNYVSKLVAPFKHRINLSTPVESIRREFDRVIVKPKHKPAIVYDAVFIACHSDQALSLLSNASNLERNTLSAIPYQKNIAVLHTDSNLLPKSRRAWAAWNYSVKTKSAGLPTLTYNMNILQGLSCDKTFCVTLNDLASVREEKINKVIEYHHPVFTKESVSAQANQDLLNCERTYFCGAYWRFGFHEDGVISALNAVKQFERNFSNAQRNILRVS